MAQQTGEWFVPSDSEPASAASPTISAAPDEAEAFFSKMESADRFFTDTFSAGAYLPVSDEDLSQDLQTTCNRIFHFLGVERSPVVPLIRKQIGRDIREVVSNYRQLAGYFADTRFFKFFKAPRPDEGNRGGQRALRPDSRPAIGSAPGRSKVRFAAVRQPTACMNRRSLHFALKCPAADRLPIVSQRCPERRFPCFPRSPYHAMKAARAAAANATNTATAVPRSHRPPQGGSLISLR